MAKYMISWTEEDWLKVEIEADSPDAALDKFHAGDYDGGTVVITESGYVQENIDIEEI